MFITIPLAIIGLSAVGIGVIVQRKMSYLKKLSPESHEVSDNIFEDFWPELIGWFKQIPWHEYQQSTLRELEKGLRRMRIAFLKIDDLALKLIQKVRKTHLTTQLEHAVQVEPEMELTVPETKEVVAEPTPEDLKGQEQQLIIEIAQDPKNALLYEKLGDLYMKMDSMNDAKDAFEAGLGFSPDNMDLARKYSRLLRKLEAAEEKTPA